MNQKILIGIIMLSIVVFETGKYKSEHFENFFQYKKKNAKHPWVRKSEKGTSPLDLFWMFRNYFLKGLNLC